MFRLLMLGKVVVKPLVKSCETEESIVMQRKINALIGVLQVTHTHTFGLMNIGAIRSCKNLQSGQRSDKMLGHLLFFPGLLNVF